MSLSVSLPPALKKKANFRKLVCDFLIYTTAFIFHFMSLALECKKRDFSSLLLSMACNWPLDLGITVHELEKRTRQMPGGLQTAVDAEKPRKMDDRFAFATFLLLGYYVVITQATVRRKGIFLECHFIKTCFVTFLACLLPIRISSGYTWHRRLVSIRHNDYIIEMAQHSVRYAKILFE